MELGRGFQGVGVEAFDELFVRYRDAITSLNQRLARDPSLAEDMTQETIVRVLRLVERIDRGFNFSAWIHRIAGSTLPNQELIGDSVDSPAMRELRREVWEVAAQLPDNYRTVLVLREFQGLDDASIAQAMSLSEAAIETLLQRARRRFKAEYLYLGFAKSDDQRCCDSLQELLSSVGLQGLRRNQRTRVQQHVDRCVDCARLAPALVRPRERRRVRDTNSRRRQSPG